jgi:hypothetical protein
LTSSTAIFLSYPPRTKKSTLNKGSPKTLPTITDLDGWTAKLLREQKWTNTHIADVWPVLMKIPYQEHVRALLAYYCHTFDDSQKTKVRSMIGQTILFR